MNEKRVESLVKILKTTIQELEDEINTSAFIFPSMGYTDDGISGRSGFNVNYSDVLTYYSNDYDDNGAGDAWD